MTRHNPLQVQQTFVCFCGAFSFSEKKKTSLIRMLRNYGAVSLDLTERERNRHTLYFYPSVVDNSYPPSGGTDYRIPVARKVQIMPDRKETTVFVEYIDIYLIENLLVYAICLNEDGMPVDVLTEINQHIRSIHSYITDDGRWNLHAGWAGIIRILVTLFNAGAARSKTIGTDDLSCSDITNLVENGNKMKTYQCFCIDETAWQETDRYTRRHLLFEVGTSSPMYSSIDKSYDMCPSAAYLKQIFDNNLIACFDNWDGLALHDSFTCIFHRCPDTAFEQFRTLYFRHIFISTFYIDRQLILFNNAYRSAGVSRRQTKEKFLAFHQQYNYDRVSYNFLPQIVYEKMRYGIGINEKTQHLEQQLQIAAEKDEKARDNSLNFLVILLSVIALISAVKDGSDLIIKDMEFFPAVVFSYRLLGCTVLAGVSIAIIVSFIYRSTK